MILPAVSVETLYRHGNAGVAHGSVRIRVCVPRCWLVVRVMMCECVSVFFCFLVCSVVCRSWLFRFFFSVACRSLSVGFVGRFGSSLPIAHRCVCRHVN